jgi:hypothetical protein
MRDRSTFAVLVTLGLCLLGIVAGLIFLSSPFWVAGGVVGWVMGYQPVPREDPALIGWFGLTALTVLVGLVLIVGSGIAGILLGIFSALAGRKKADASLEKLPRGNSDTPA